VSRDDGGRWQATIDIYLIMCYSYIKGQEKDRKPAAYVFLVVEMERKSEETK